MTEKKKFERSIFEVYFGYRSLLDWSHSSNWKRGTESENTGQFRLSKDAGKNMEFGDQLGYGSHLAGPKTFPPRQRLNFWGQKKYDKTSAKLPGDTGAYFDVRNNTPSGSAPKGTWKELADDDVQGNIDAIMNDLGQHAQQWLYLAAENMAAQSKSLLSAGKISNDEIDLLTALLGDEEQIQGNVREIMMSDASPDETAEVIAHEEEENRKFLENSDPALRLMGTSQAKGSKIFPTGFGTHTTKTSAGLRTRDMSRIPWLQMNVNRETSGQKQFRGMLTGVQGQWINAFAESVINTISADGGGLMKLALSVGERLSEMGLKFHPEGKPVVFEPSKISGAKGGGQTPQEFAAIKALGDLEFATGETIEETGAGHGIDIRFKKHSNLLRDAQSERAGRTTSAQIGRQFTRADLTTSFFRTGKHHGIGTPLNEKGEKLKAGTSIPESEQFIREYYNRDRIPKYNELIKMIMGATGTKRTKDSQQSAAIGRGQVLRARKEWKKLDKTTKSRHINSVAKSAIYDEGLEWISNDLEWVLHHMANMLPGGVADPDPYAMTAPILLNKNPRDVGTVFVVFEINSDGTYKEMDMNPEDGIDGSYVYITSDAPMDWLYGKAVAEGYNGTFNQFVDEGSIATTAETLNFTRQSGELFIHQSSTGQNLNQQIRVSQLSAPVVDEKFREITDDFFNRMASNMETKLAKDIHNQAVQYSVEARNPESINEIDKWFNFGVNYLMTKRASDDYLKDIYHNKNISRTQPKAALERIWKEFDIGGASLAKKVAGGDPYWYLWAAPYISRKRVEIGGAQTGYLQD